MKLKTALILMLVLLSGCDDPTGPSPSKTGEFFSFEMDMEGWNPNGMDLELGSTTIDWSITRSQELAIHGDTSLKFDLDNLNDAGKIWIERPFAVKPHHTYQVTVEYAFASADWGDFNLFTIITGVLQKPPQTRDELVPTYQGQTGNGDSSDLGYKWLNKKYEFTARSNGDGTLYVLIGVWGTWETHRTYYFDSIHVTAVEK